MSKLNKIKRELLEETNYRCGYCMRNIINLYLIQSRWYEPDISHEIQTLQWWLNEIKKVVFPEKIMSFNSLPPIEDSDKVNLNGSIALFITEEGVKFCQKFIDVCENV